MRLVFAALTFLSAMCGVAAAQGNDANRLGYELTATAGGDYDFPNNFYTPVFDPSSIESTLTAGVSYGYWSASVSYVEGDNEDDGFGARVGYKHKDCGIADLTCSAAVKWRDVGDASTMTYESELSYEWSEASDWVTPSVTVGAKAVTGDRSETAVSAGVGLEFPLWDDENGFGFSATGGASYGLESEHTEPTWSAEVSYTHDMGTHRSLMFSVGYESVLTLDEQGALDVDRSGTAKIRFRF